MARGFFIRVILLGLALVLALANIASASEISIITCGKKLQIEITQNGTSLVVKTPAWKMESPEKAKEIVTEALSIDPRHVASITNEDGNYVLTLKKGATIGAFCAQWEGQRVFFFMAFFTNRWQERGQIHVVALLNQFPPGEPYKTAMPAMSKVLGMIGPGVFLVEGDRAKMVLDKP